MHTADPTQLWREPVLAAKISRQKKHLAAATPSRGKITLFPKKRARQQHCAHRRQGHEKTHPTRPCTQEIARTGSLHNCVGSAVCTHRQRSHTHTKHTSFIADLVVYTRTPLHPAALASVPIWGCISSSSALVDFTTRYLPPLLPLSQTSYQAMGPVHAVPLRIF